MRQPSIELLSEVLEIDDIKEYECRDNECHIVRYDLPLPMGNQHILINVYELMYKMKVWSAKQNFKVVHELSYGIESGRARLIQYQEFDMYDVFGYKIGRTSKSDWFEDNSEHEAVTKTCEWVLEHKKELK